MPMESSGGSIPQQPEIWQPGTEVLAMYDFRGTTREDLPFTKGDILTIVKNTRDVNWYKAKNKSEQEGMIPATYVQKRKEVSLHERKEVSLHAMPWFHGKIDRTKADELLNPRTDGLFLVRESKNFPGDYTLSVCCGNKVEHYRIIYSCNKLTIDEEGYFDNLTELVEHYTKDADGLCTRLIQPLPKKGESFGFVSSGAFTEAGWEIKKSEVEFGEAIGKGEFGEVLKGLYQGKPVAIKKLKDNNRAAQAFLREASLMTSVHHPNLVALKGIIKAETIYIVLEYMGKGNLAEYSRTRGRGVITKKNQINYATSVRHPNLVGLIGIIQAETIYLLLEYMGKGNLATYLQTRGRGIITKQNQINYATDTCSAMAYLETNKLVHRDLAARNVLLNDEGIAKVSDFGLANHADFNPSGGKFPIKWTAPEALRDNKFTSKSDMWSFGILLWEIYSFGRVPYPRIPLSDVVMHVERGYRMEAPEGCPPEVYAIMTDAWAKDPEKRPTFEEVRKKLENLKAITV